MLYYTTIILLYRPFRSNSSCRAACREAAEGVESLLLRMEQVFGLSRCTYIMAYCAYTAATVAVQDTRDGVPGARRRLDTYIRALKALSQSCPGIHRSIDIISRCLASDVAVTSLADSDQTNEPLSGAADVAANEQDAAKSMNAPEFIPVGDSDSMQYQMPAFPFGYDAPNFEGNGTVNTGPSAQDPATQCFSNLDSYPQNWLDMSDGILDDLNLGYFGTDVSL